MDWHAMVFLGAYHGINPGMGWLFAVALGLQQGSARGVWRALPPIAAGHALSVGGVLVIVGLAQLVLPAAALNALLAGLLISMGVYRLWRHRHPRFGGMQVGFRDLTTWSFLMASAHGAGLMVLPFVMPPPTATNTSATSRPRTPPPAPWRSRSTRRRISSSRRLRRGSSTASWASGSFAPPGST